MVAIPLRECVMVSVYQHDSGANPFELGAILDVSHFNAIG